MIDVKALRALLDKATKGPLAVGWTLPTARTRLWTPMERASNDREERRRVFARFTPVDEGRSRQLVAVANDPDDAALHVAAVNALPDLLSLAEAVRELAPVLRALTDDRSMIVADGGRGGLMMDAADRDNLRALLAILEPPRAAGDGR